MQKYPGLFLLIPVLLGIIVADQGNWPTWLWLAAAASMVTIGVIAAARQKRMVAIAAFGLALMGASALNFSLRYSEQSPRHLTKLIEAQERYHIFGTVTDWPDLKPHRTEIKLTVDSLIGTEVHFAEGSLMLSISDTSTAIQRGDRLEFTSRIYPIRSSRSASGFDYGRFLRLRGISGVAYLPSLLNVRIDRGNRYGIFHLVDRLRQGIVESFDRNLSPVGAALASGFLIGETRNIPTNVYNMFRGSGTLHLLAVSGSNVALILMMAIVLLWPFSVSRTKRAIVLIGVIIIFCILSYLEPSVVRASVMATLVILAGLVGRRYDLNQIIALTGFIVLLADPAQLYSVGFQLSFATAWGLIFAVPRLTLIARKVGERWSADDLLANRMQDAPPWQWSLLRWIVRLHPAKIGKWFLFSLTVTIVAQVVSAPILALYFHQIPLLSPIANLIIVPAVSLGVVGVLVLLIADLVWPVLGIFVGSLLDILLQGIVSILEKMGGEQMPMAEIGDFSTLSALIAYAFIIVGTVALTNRKGRRLFVVAVLILVNILVVRVAVADLLIDKTDKATFFTVPGGVAGVVTLKNGNASTLFVTNLYARDYPTDERILLPALKRIGVTRLDMIFVQSCEYSAVDDLLRVADQLNPTTIFVHPRLLHSFRDELIAESDSGRSFDVIAWTNIRHEYGSPGIYPDDDNLVLLQGESAIIFGKSDAWTKLVNSDNYLNRVWVVDNSQGSSASSGLGEIGGRPTAIICSGIEQVNSVKQAFSDSSRIIDLRQLGIYELHLKETAD